MILPNVCHYLLLIYHSSFMVIIILIIINIILTHYVFCFILPQSVYYNPKIFPYIGTT